MHLFLPLGNQTENLNSVLFDTAVPLWGLEIGGKDVGIQKTWELKSGFFSESGCDH